MCCFVRVLKRYTVRWFAFVVRVFCWRCSVRCAKVKPGSSRRSVQAPPVCVVRFCCVARPVSVQGCSLNGLRLWFAPQSGDGNPIIANFWGPKILAVSPPRGRPLEIERAQAKREHVARQRRVPRIRPGKKMQSHTETRRVCTTPKGRVCTTPKGRVCTTPKGRVCTTPEGRVCTTSKGRICTTPKVRVCTTPKRRSVRPLKGESVRHLKGESVRPLKGESVQPLKGESVRLLNGESVRLLKG